MTTFRFCGVALIIATARAIAAFWSTGDFGLGTTIFTVGFRVGTTSSGALFSPVKKGLERTSSNVSLTPWLPLSL